MSPESMLATVDRAGDGPRGAHVAAAYGLRERALVYLGGDLANAGEIDRRISRGSINQREGYRAGLYSLAPEQSRPGLIQTLSRQLVELLESELLSGTYAAINRGWVLAYHHVAQRIGDAEVERLALAIMARVVAVEEALECPPSAHPELRGRCVAPGGRSGDRNGMSAERDECRALETTGRPLDRIRTGQRWVEVHMVRDAIESGRLPKLKPAPLAEVGTRWPLRVRYFEHGHEAVFAAGMDRAVGALEAVSVDYRMAPGPGDARWQHGAAVEQVGWDTWAPKWKGGQPEGWKFPWRPGAPSLPKRDLGRLLREVVIGAGGEVAPERPERPEPPSPSPGRPESPSPPPREQSGPPIPAEGHHVSFRLPGVGRVVVNVKPGHVWDGLRWQPDGGEWQDFR